MKKSVNGKAFDEIFEQRGERVQPENMINGNAYFWSDTNNPDLSLLIIFDELDRWDIYFTLGIFNNMVISLNKSYHNDSEDFFFEATPDQIDLLNAYKNESK